MPLVGTLVRCYCGSARVNPEHCDMVIDDIPICRPECLTKKAELVLAVERLFEVQSFQGA